MEDLTHVPDWLWTRGLNLQIADFTRIHWWTQHPDRAWHYLVFRKGRVVGQYDDGPEWDWRMRKLWFGAHDELVRWDQWISR